MRYNTITMDPYTTKADHGSGGSYAVTKGDLYNYNYDQNYYQVSGLDIKVQIRKKLPNITTTFNAESPHPSPPLGETTLP